MPQSFSVARKFNDYFCIRLAVTFDAVPGSILVDPGIGESAGVLVGLPVVQTLRVIDTDNDSCVADLGLNVEVLHAHDGGLELGIANVGEELVARAQVGRPIRC